MTGNDIQTHRHDARALRDRVLGGGVADEALRRAVLEREGGGAPLPEPYDALVRRINADSARVTDADVSAVRDAAGSEKAAFELVLAAAAGAGLRRWNAAERAIAEAADAAR